MTKETIELLASLLGQVQIKPLEPNAVAQTEAIQRAMEELREEAKALVETTKE